MAKVLLLNGSPRPNGCTATALKEMIPVFEAEGIETEIIHVGNKDIRGCISCGSCAKTGKCIFNDLVNEVAPKFEAADGLVVGSPVYYASPNGTILSFMMAVTTLSLPSLIMLKKAIKPKLMAVFIAICTIGIIIVGYGFNILQTVLI